MICGRRLQVVVISFFGSEHQGAGDVEDAKGNAHGAGLGAGGADEQGTIASANGDSGGAGLAGGEQTHAFSGGQDAAEEEQGAEKAAKGTGEDEHEEEEEDRKQREEEQEERLRVQDEEKRLREEEDAARFTEMAKSIMLRGAVGLVACAPPRRIASLKHYCNERSDEIFIAIPLILLDDVALCEKFQDGDRVDLVYDPREEDDEQDADPVDPVFPLRRAIFTPPQQRSEAMKACLRGYLASFRRCFYELTDADVDTLCLSLQHKLFPALGEIFQQGSKHDACYIVGSGKVELTSRDHTGKPVAHLCRSLGPGAYFGELGVVRDDGVRTYSAVSGEANLELLVVTRGNFQMMARERHMQEIMTVAGKDPGERSPDDISDLLAFLGLADEGPKTIPWHRPELVFCVPTQTPQTPQTPRLASKKSMQTKVSTQRSIKSIQRNNSTSSMKLPRTGSSSFPRTGSSSNTRNQTGLGQNSQSQTDGPSSLGVGGHQPHHSHHHVSAGACHRDLQFIKQGPSSVRRHLASLFRARVFRPGDLVCADGESHDALFIVLKGECVVTGGMHDGEIRSEGMCWGLMDLDSRISTVTARAQNEVHMLELSRLDYITANAAPQQDLLTRRFEIFRSCILQLPSASEQDLGAILFSDFHIHTFVHKEIISQQGAHLDVIKGAGVEGDADTDGASADGPVTELFLDFITRGSVQLLHKTEFLPIQDRVPTPMCKNLAILELSVGDCYTALDIFGNRNTWSCSAVVTSDVVEVLRIRMSDFRSVVTPQRLKKLEAASLTHNRSRANTLRSLVRCQEEMSCDSGKPCALKGDDLAVFDRMGLAPSLQPGFSKRRLLQIRPLEEAPPENTRPQTARPKISAFEGAAGKSRVAVAAQSTPGHRLKQAASEQYEALLAPKDPRAVERTSSYLPISRPETARTRARTKELAVPSQRKTTLPIRQNEFANQQNLHHDAVWCSPTLPQFGGTVYMCKLKWKLGYPVYCPFQIRNGGVFNLPFIRLDDILFREAQKQTKENMRRRLHNEARADSLLRTRKAHLSHERTRQEPEGNFGSEVDAT